MVFMIGGGLYLVILIVSGLLRDPEETAPPREEMEVIESRGRCLVCGGPLRENVVHCRRCRTPHHEECWRYFGSCSTYGCREERF
jgi:hypothetical protein